MTNRIARALPATLGILLSASVADAQVFVRAPFVRVQVNPDGGVAVRAPFVGVNTVPMYSAPPLYYAPPIVQPPPVVDIPAQPLPSTQPPVEVLPAPKPAVVPSTVRTSAPLTPRPAEIPVKSPDVLTLDDFVRTFQPTAGVHEVRVINPSTKQPVTVRFILPEGQPKRVHSGRHYVEFFYGFRQFVRIEFDSDGVQVLSR